MCSNFDICSCYDVLSIKVKMRKCVMEYTFIFGMRVRKTIIFEERFLVGGMVST